MSDTISVKVKKNVQPNNFELHGVPMVLRGGDNTVKIEHWLVIKKIPGVERKISRGFVSVDKNEEFRATESFQKECFSEFERLGIYEVKISSQKGKLSEGAKHSFALKWLSLKEEFREESRDTREIVTLSIARANLKTSQCGIVVSTIIALVTIFITWQ